MLGRKVAIIIGGAVFTVGGAIQTQVPSTSGEPSNNTFASCEHLSLYKYRMMILGRVVAGTGVG